mmetsp:Transcript_24973/g.43117  ORF Transcript_24973/g.43117 Transcript_24973/m.43117 type:complete len:194 (+) Transcript_24973:85-666(+)
MDCKFVFFLICVLLAWTSDGLDSPSYEVIEKAEDYEIRKYKPEQVWAQVQVNVESFQEAEQTGFKYLFDFISGHNSRQESIPMTAPVTMVRNGKAFIVSFFMPSQYSSVEDVPTPAEAAIHIVAAPGRVYAVSFFGGYATEAVWSDQVSQLKDSLGSAGLKWSPDAPDVLAQYNSPFRFIFRHNEVWLPLVHS